MNRERSTLKRRVVDIVTALVAFIWLTPLVFTILMSLRPSNQPLTQGNIFFGSALTLDNYSAAWDAVPWHIHYLTSAIVVVGILSVQVVTITLAGYAFARMKFAGKGLLLLIVLAQLMIPAGVLLVQNFATIRRLDLFDTRLAMMIPYWGSAFGTLLMRQSFLGIPYEFEEAARIDGANLFHLLRHVYVPLSLPAYVAFALVSISSHWNEFFWPFIITRSAENRPVTVGLNLLLNATDVGARYGQQMAGTMLVILPLIIFFMIFQRQFIESYAQSGLK